MQPMTPVVKNLIIINVIFYLATQVIGQGGVLPLPYLTEQFGAFYPGSPMFKPWQIITHMFMHSHVGLMHIFFNMFALYMFGTALERVWGAKRFLIYYFVCGLGAFFLHQLVNAIEIYNLTAQIFPKPAAFPSDETRYMFYYIPVVGASGAVFGLLLGFGMLFPNTRIMLLFPPIPIRAKVFVFIFGALELFLAFSNSGSNIAHFAHLGGMVFGYLLLKHWQKSRDVFY